MKGFRLESLSEKLISKCYSFDYRDPISLGFFCLEIYPNMHISSLLQTYIARFLPPILQYYNDNLFFNNTNDHFAT
jgi:hypothetical protein